MKSILYILISVFILSIVAQAIPYNTNEASEKVALKVVLSDLNWNKVNDVTTTLNNRLECLDIEGYKLSPNQTDHSLQIEFNHLDDYNKVKSILSPKGELRFCEMLSAKEFCSHLDSNSEMAKLLGISNLENHESKAPNKACIGLYSDNERIKISKNLQEQVQDFENCLAWSIEKQDGKWALYSIRLSNAIDGSFVDDSKVHINKKKQVSILITFTSQGADNWALMTKQNVGNPIAITMDNTVYSMPVVQQEISGGKAMITGSFTKDEADMLNAVISGGSLPEALNIN